MGVYMYKFISIFTLALLLISCQIDHTILSSQQECEEKIETLSPEDITPGSFDKCWNITKFAVVGDIAGTNESTNQVSELIKSWNPNFIITLGDNFYNNINHDPDTSIGQFYSEYIYPYFGVYTPSPVNYNRFWPSIGGHDWNYDRGQTYIDYFTLPGNERYYDFKKDNIHFFCYNSEIGEPDGSGIGSIQAQWLENGLINSEKNFKIVYFHASPYSSGLHGSEQRLQLPFEQWGTDVVFTGHDHHYERLQIDGITYVINGMGGQGIRNIYDPVPGSIVRYNEKHGAMLIFVLRRIFVGFFINIDRQIIDVFMLRNRIKVKRLVRNIEVYN